MSIEYSATEVSYFKTPCPLSITSEIVGLFSMSEASIIFTHSTPFHPADYLTWDQPGDRGDMHLHGHRIVIANSQTMVYCKKNRIFVKPSTKSEMYRGIESGYLILLVGHVVLDTADSGIQHLKSDAVGSEVELNVDGKYREDLSRAHTAVHIMSLMLNEQTSSCWRKEGIQIDSRGYKNTDAMTIGKAKISPLKSSDQYRFGKSIRKKGFDSAVLQDIGGPKLGDLITSSANDIISRNKNIAIENSGEGNLLGTRRVWMSELDGVSVSIPCGGTHLSRIGDIGTLCVEVTLHDNASGMDVETSVV